MPKRWPPQNWTIPTLPVLIKLTEKVNQTIEAINEALKERR